MNGSEKKKTDQVEKEKQKRDQEECEEEEGIEEWWAQELADRAEVCAQQDEAIRAQAHENDELDMIFEKQMRDIEEEEKWQQEQWEKEGREEVERARHSAIYAEWDEAYEALRKEEYEDEFGGA